MVRRKDNILYGPVAVECNAVPTGTWRIKRPVINEKCISCKTCISYCPCMSIECSDNKKIIIDYTYCKGCGICSTVCRRCAIDMIYEKETEKNDQTDS